MKPTTIQVAVVAAIATTFASWAISAAAQNVSSTAEPHPQHKTQHMGQRTNAHGPMDPAQRAERQQRMAQRHDQRMERLKTLLQITPAQEAAFKTFAARTEPAPPKAMMATEDGAQLTTLQRLDKMQAMHDTRQAEMAQRIDAIRVFYAQLTPAQQKSFDTLADGFLRTSLHGEHHMVGKKEHSRHGGERQGTGGRPTTPSNN